MPVNGYIIVMQNKNQAVDDTTPIQHKKLNLQSFQLPKPFQIAKQTNSNR